MTLTLILGRVEQPFHETQDNETTTWTDEFVLNVWTCQDRSLDLRLTFPVRRKISSLNLQSAI